MKGFHVVSLGCKVNSYECASISCNLMSHGYVENKDNPDVVIINTCSVTSTADQKSRQHIRQVMNQFPQAITVVMGCYAQGQGKFIFDEIQPTIVIGTSHRKDIYSLIVEYENTHKRIFKVDENPRLFDYEELGIASFTENTRAYLKIQDGCNNFCSYCLIPYVRGKMRSREKSKILQEAQYLVEQGYQEIVLCGIHVGGYGQDLNGETFSSLVESLSNICGLKRLRISSIEISEIDDKLIELIRDRKNIAKHLHIPLQSGSTKVLQSMNRKYTAEEYISKLTKIRNEIPDIALSSDVITGFPGETDEDQANTINTIVSSTLNQLHIFPYSVRNGTVAAKMKNQIDPTIKNARARDLRNLSNDLWNKYVENFIGKPINVLIEKFDEKLNKYFGHSTNYIDVYLENDGLSIGQYVDIILQKDMIVSR